MTKHKGFVVLVLIFAISAFVLSSCSDNREVGNFLSDDGASSSSSSSSTSSSSSVSSSSVSSTSSSSSVSSSSISSSSSSSVDAWVLDNFDDASDNNCWGGINQCNEGAPGTITATFDTSIYRGSSGQSLKLDYYAPAGGWSGYELPFSAKDLSAEGYTTITFWARTDGVTSTGFKVELADAGGVGKVYILDYLDVALDTTWRQIEIPLDAYVFHGGDFSEINSLKITFEDWYISDNSFDDSGIVYIDDIEFTTNVVNSVRIDHFGDNHRMNALGGEGVNEVGSGSHTISYSSTVYDGTPNAMRAVYDTNGGWCGYSMPFEGAGDFSAYTKLTLSIKGGDISSDTPTKIKIELHDDASWPWPVAYIPDDTVEGTAISTDWTDYTINLSSFYDSVTPANLDPSTIEKLVIVYEDSSVGDNKSGVVYFDQIEFEK